MRASTAKASRQQIRKAFGPSAVDALSDVTANVADLRTRTARMESALHARIAALEAERARLKSFRQRLIWAFRG